MFSSSTRGKVLPVAVGFAMVLSVWARCDSRAEDNCADTNAVKGTPAPAVPAKAVKRQTVCPVMGGDIDKAVYVDHDGKRIYMCCKGCIAAVKKDPVKYIKALEASGVVLDTVPAADKAGKEGAAK